MSSFQPTWLYIKQHNSTGLKYFGMTRQKDPVKYTGSGKYWRLHLKKHGTDVTTVWTKLFEDVGQLKNYAEQFSKENNIVDSLEWANLKIETGDDGGGPGIPKGSKLPKQSADTIAKRVAKLTGQKRTTEQRMNAIAAHTGKHSALRAKGFKKKPHTAEHKANTSAALLGKKKSPQVTLMCPCCNKVGGASNMKRYHFANCKTTAGVTL